MSGKIFPPPLWRLRNVKERRESSCEKEKLAGFLLSVMFETFELEYAQGLILFLFFSKIKKLR